MEYYSAIERKAVTHPTVWMYLENIMPSKSSQTKKDHIVRDSIYMK